MIRFKLSFFVTLLSIFVIPFAAWADDFHVTTDQELQTAIFNIGNTVGNHTLYLAAGSYTAAFTVDLIECNSLTIKPEDGLNPGQVVFDGQNGHRCLFLNGSTRAIDITLSRLTFKDGSITSSGAGAWLKTGGAITVDACNFNDNTIPYVTTGYPGAALYIENTGSNPTALTNCSVTDNANNCTVATQRAQGYKAVYIDAASTAAVTVTGNYIARNVQGGISIKGPDTLIFSGNTLIGNEIGNGSGGGAYLDANNGISFENNIVKENRAGSCGGVWINGNATLVGNTIRNNTDTGARGGGIRWDGQVLVMRDNQVQGNTSVHTGGGIFIDLTSRSNTSVTLENNTFLNNASENVGGGVCIDTNNNDIHNVVLKNNIVAKNQAGNTYSGGGLYVECSDLDLVNNTITDNAAVTSGGILISASATADVYNNIIWGNTATSAGSPSGDIGLASSGIKKGYFNTFHAIGGLWTTAGNNIDVDPLFIDATNNDFHLGAASLCLDAGLNTAPGIPATDADGNPRILNTTVDLGAYEHSTGDYHPADTSPADWVISAAEFTAYGTSWKTTGSPVPIDYVTRAGYLLQNGAPAGAYKNIGGGKPLCWVPGP